MDTQLEAMMRAMLGDDVIALVEKLECVEVLSRVVDEGEVPLSRTAMKKRMRAAEKDEREKRMRGEYVIEAVVERMEVVEVQEVAAIEQESEQDSDSYEEQSQNDMEFDGCDSDDSEDLMSNLHESEQAVTLKDPAKGPLVIVYEAVKPKPSLFGSTQMKRSFMSSKMTTLSDIIIPSTAIGVVRKKRITPVDKEQDAEDEQHDKDLHDLLKTTKLLEQYTSADLTGRDRRSYLKGKIIEATKGKGVKSDGIIHPFAIREGIEGKRVKAVAVRLEDAKERGIYTASSKHLYRDTVKEEREGAKTGKIKGRMGSGGKSGSGGLTASIGKYKDGTLHIGKKDIENAQRGVKGNFGIVKRSFEHVNRPKSKGGFKKNKKR